MLKDVILDRCISGMSVQLIPSVIVSASLLAGVIVTGVAAEEGRGKPDDWFVKSD